MKSLRLERKIQHCRQFFRISASLCLSFIPHFARDMRNVKMEEVGEGERQVKREKILKRSITVIVDFWIEFRENAAEGKPSCIVLNLPKAISGFCVMKPKWKPPLQITEQKNLARSFQSVNKISLITKAIAVQCNENFHVIAMTAMNKQSELTRKNARCQRLGKNVSQFA